MKPSIHILFEHAGDSLPFGCSYIRLLLPLTHPAAGSGFEVTSGTEYQSADIVIVERTWRPATTVREAEALVERIRKDGACFLYAIDDNLLDLEQVAMADKMVVRYLARQADGVLVSTEALRRRFTRLNPTVISIPNTLDERLFGLALEAEGQASGSPGPFTIGYMGTFTHDADLMLIYRALRTVLRRHAGSVEFQLVGGAAQPATLRLFQDLPFRQLTVPTADVAYPKFVHWMLANARWDLALAPLEDTHFNRYKSDIKFLDYSALGMPGLYSQVPSYTGSVRHLETGYLVENTPEAWIKALEHLLADEDLRAGLAARAQSYVFSERTLEHCAWRWREAIQKTCSIER